MRTQAARALGLILVAVATITITIAVAQTQPTPTTPRVTKADIERWKTELSNWGRWGKDDQLGALNLITPTKRRQAAALVKEGFPVSLAREEYWEKSEANPTPYGRKMYALGHDRLDDMGPHSFYHTHIDSLAHVFDAGKGYNGYAPVLETVMKANGHAKNSIGNVRQGIFTRGVLIDLPKLKGVPFLEPGTPIYPADLEAWEKRAGVKVSAGDALLIRTGRWVRWEQVGPWNVDLKMAGLDPSCIPWLRQRDVALLLGETPHDVHPPAQPELATLDMGNRPGRVIVHNFTLIYLGAHVVDNVDLDELSEAASARNRWEFLFTLAPLPLATGTGSPVNPIATF
jgi:kynurenine formamidase